MNLKCTYVLRRFLALFLLGYISLGAIGAENSVSDDRKVWQESYPDRDDYLSNRRALVGRGCMVNRFGSDGIKVLNIQTNLENLCDDDLTNNATIPCVAKLDIGYSPLVSVRDLGNRYAAGTQAGFMLGGSSSILGINVGSIYKIRFYLNGELVKPEGAGDSYVGETVSSDMNTGVDISLIQIDGEDMSREIHANAPGEFDEIQIVQVGVSANLGNAIQVKYAFAGKARHFTITQNSVNGMPAYSDYIGTDVKPWGKWNKGDWKDSDKQHGDIDHADPEFQGYKLINTNLDDGAPIVVSALISFMGNASVKGEAYDGSKAVNPFKAGTQIGFVINQKSLLNVGVGTTAVIELTDVNDNHKAYNISTDVLELSLGKETGDATFSILSDMDFSEAKFYFAGLGIGAGEASAKYAFINLEPEKGNHHCSINPSADLDICDCDNHYKLNSAIDVTWTVKESPADDFTLNRETGEVAGLTTAGRYVFTATAADGCTEDVVINYGISAGRLEETPLTNSNDNDNYEVMTGEGWGIDLLSNLSNANALVTPSIRDYAYYTGGVQLLSNKNIIGVKAKNGLISHGTEAVKAGFVISGGNNVLNAKLLKFLNIRLYKNGEEVESGIIKDNSVLSTGLIGDENTQRVKFSVSVPAGTEFDAMVLYTSGVLSLDVNQMNIYYAFVDNTDGESDPLYGSKIVSLKNTGASIDAKETISFSVANVGTTPSDLSRLIDDDLDNAYTFPTGITVGNGTTVAVKIGKTISPKQQLVLVTTNGNALLGLGLADVFKFELYKNGEKVASNSSSDTEFKVLNANVLGYTGTKGYICITSPVEFDEIKLTQVQVLEALNAFGIYGMAINNDYNQDGTPDQLDPEPCVQELVLDENFDLKKNHDYSNCRMILCRTFNGGKWNSLVLPVSLTKEQFHEAFGSGAQLSEIDCVTTEGNNRIINFKTVQASDGTYLKENTPYIIYIEEAETEKHPADEQYQSIEDGVVQGPIYIVNSGVDYQMENDKDTKIEVTSEITRELSYLGSYVSNQRLPIDCYIFSNGNLFHTSKEYQMKAYRCWIEYQTDDDTPLAKFSVNNTATGIDCITDNIENADSHIYNISGQKIENTDNLPEGIYIINGKKLIIK